MSRLIAALAACGACGGDDDGPVTADATPQEIDSGSLPSIDATSGEDAAPEGGQRRFRLERGFDGYDGARDTTLSAVLADVPINDVIMQFAGNGATDTEPDGLQRALVYFDLAPVADAVGRDGCDVHVLAAELLVYVQTADAIYMSLSLMDPEGPMFDEATATWNDASDGVAWQAPGGDIGGLLDVKRADVGWAAFKVDGNVVESWLCQPEQNRGMALRIFAEGGSQWAQAPASEVPVADGEPRLRPALVIDLTY